MKLAGFAVLAIVPLCAVRLVLADARLHAWFPLLAAPAGLVHGAMYSMLLCVFAGSLRRGREPVVTRVARRVRGELPPELELYTRRLTMVWCAFFAAQLAVSGGLLAFAPLTVWLAFISLWNLPLLLAMCAAEYCYRLVRYRHIKHESILGMVRAMREVRSMKPLP